MVGVREGDWWRRRFNQSKKEIHKKKTIHRISKDSQGHLVHGDGEGDGVASRNKDSGEKWASASGAGVVLPPEWRHAVFKSTTDAHPMAFSSLIVRGNGEPYEMSRACRYLLVCPRK